MSGPLDEPDDATPLFRPDRLRHWWKGIGKTGRRAAAAE